MAGELIILPVRIGARVTRFAVRTGVRATGEAVSFAAGIVKSATGGAAPAREWPTPPAPAPPEHEPARGQARHAPPPPPPPEPIHVSEEPELVEEVAEPGAEDGAAAEVTVAEPWTGYRQMKADDVIDRVSTATPAELAAVQLYENANRRRETVLSAVRHGLRAADQLRKEQADAP